MALVVASGLAGGIGSWGAAVEASGVDESNGQFHKCLQRIRHLQALVDKLDKGYYKDMARGYGEGFRAGYKDGVI